MALEYNWCVQVFSLIFFITMLSFFSIASDFDETEASALKIEANFNAVRLENYKSEVQNNKIFNREREKGLAEYLEEQESFDLIRERGVRDYKREKRVSSMDENSLAYKQYLKEIRSADKDYEESRRVYAKTRDKFKNKTSLNSAKIEFEELGLNSELPRFELSKRSKNKWVSGISAGRGTVGIPSGGGYQAPAPPPIDYSPVQEFPPAPPAYEGFDEIPPAPPMYDNSGGIPYDPSFGAESSLPIPPPPPPPPDFDF